MKDELNALLDHIGEEYATHIQRGSRHYLEVSIAKRAESLGYAELRDRYRDAYAVVPLKMPQRGMKVRIDGRTFVNYAEHASGIAVPGYLAKEAGRPFKTFIPNDSMICNFT
ncbi:MAG: hypothetical protein LJE65_08305 [Desulfobacteraceae bacterium]|nr:hypothetical protein [Desulfobacteraceae bacterium]